MVDEADDFLEELNLRDTQPSVLSEEGRVTMLERTTAYSAVISDASNIMFNIHKQTHAYTPTQDVVRLTLVLRTHQTWASGRLEEEGVDSSTVYAQFRARLKKDFTAAGYGDLL